MNNVSENIVLIGCCGSGKSTIAQFYKEAGHTSILASDYLRIEMQRENENAKVIKACVVSGGIIPDQVIFGVILPILRNMLRPPFVLEGFPVTIPQLKVLEEELSQRGILDKTRFIFLDASKETVLQRLSGRRTCPECFSVYNVETKPPKEAEKCDHCYVDLFTRSQDDPKIVEKRLNIFNKTTRPMIELLKEKGYNLSTIDANGNLSLSDIEGLLPSPSLPLVV